MTRSLCCCARWPGAARSAPFMSTVSPSLAPDVDVDLAESRLYNADLAPVPLERRKWRVGSFAALWISMSACIPTYMLASSLIGGGMNWSQAILTIFLGNLIVLIPMILNAHAGTHYGIPFPGFLPRLVRHARREHPGADARVRRVRLVRHPNLDRRQRDLQNPGGLRALAGDAARQLPVLDITLRAVRLFPLFLGHQHAGHLQGHRLHPLAAEHQSAAAHRARLAAAGVGLSQSRRLRTDPLAAVGVRSRPAESRASSGRSSSRRSPA